MIDDMESDNNDSLRNQAYRFTLNYWPLTKYDKFACDYKDVQEMLIEAYIQGFRDAAKPMDLDSQIKIDKQQLESAIISFGDKYVAACEKVDKLLIRRELDKLRDTDNQDDCCGSCDNCQMFYKSYE